MKTYKSKIRINDFEVRNVADSKIFLETMKATLYIKILEEILIETTEGFTVKFKPIKKEYNPSYQATEFLLECIVSTDEGM